MAELKIQQSLWDDFVAVAERQQVQPDELAERVLRDYIQRAPDEELLAALSARHVAPGFAWQTVSRSCGTIVAAGQGDGASCRFGSDAGPWSSIPTCSVRSFKARGPTNFNRRIVRLWLLEKRLQLVVSRELSDEYLEIFAQVLGMGPALVEEWRLRFEQDSRVTVVRMGASYTESRDPDDNIVLATALAGKARFLVTNDRDLLDLPIGFQRRQPFEIVNPQQFLRQIEG